MTADLLSLLGVSLRRVASTGGGRGEFVGPCFACGGKDRFHIQPDFVHPDGDVGRWFCRQCSPHWDDAPALVMRLHNVRYPEALAILGQDKPVAAPCSTLHAPPTPQPPDEAWQARARAFLAEAVDALWSDAGASARAWLAQRGFTHEVLAVTQVGYHPSDRRDDPAAWGLPGDRHVWLPRGIVLPWFAHGALWNLEIRRPLTASLVSAGQAKYISVRGGSKQLLLGLDDMVDDGLRDVILVEGFFDRLALLQTCADLVTPLAAGSTTGARQSRALIRLAAATRQVLVAFDADDAGDEAATWWLSALPSARRWRPDPPYKDVADMLAQGVDLHAWLDAGLSPQPSALSPQPSALSTHLDTDPCAVCGQPFDRYAPDGRPLCAAHYAERVPDAPAAADVAAPLPTPSHPAPCDLHPVTERKLPALIPIPRATKLQRCRSCGADMYWVDMGGPPGPHALAKLLPVSVNPAVHPDAKPPTATEPGLGFNHFVDCPSREQHRRTAA